MDKDRVSVQAVQSFSDSSPTRGARRGSVAGAEADAEYRRAVALFRSGRPQEAMRLLEDAIRREPAAGSPRHLAGIVALSGGDFEAARGHFQSAIRLAGSPAEAAASWVGLGRVEFSVAGAKKALACFQRAEQLAPAFAPALSGEAAAWCDLGDYSRAESCARAGLALAADPGTQLILARCLLFQSRMDESESLLRELSAVPETNFMARYHLAAIAFSRGDLGEAERGFRSVLKEQPRHPGWVELSKTKKFTNEDDPDLQTMRGLLAALPSDADRMGRFLRADLSFALAKACDDLGEPDRAFPLLHEANELHALDDPFDFSAFGRRIERVTALTRRIYEGGFASGGEQSGAWPLVIAALPRSGSSLLEQMLGGHSAIRPGGEFSRILPVLDGAVGKAASGPAAGVEGEASFAAARRDIAAVLGAEKPGVRFVTEKSLIAFLYAGLLAGLFPQTKIIHLQRHPLDLALSQYMQSFVTGLGWTSNLDTIVDYYLAYERLMALWKRLAGANMIELRYETLVREPERQLRRVLGFCGLDYEPACLEFERRERPVWTASGFQVRQSVNGRSVGKWRRYAKYLEPVKTRLHDSIVAYESALNREIPASEASDRNGR